jgi:pimeloyl-ACP methyl ester carboxylesterase
VPFLTVQNRRIEFAEIPARRRGAPPLVFLHEGLGSLALWRDFPARVAEATGAAALVYSRHGYGRSERLTAPRAVDYMHREALETLPDLLALRGVANPILIGHSDGASIAILHAGARRWPVAGLVLMAPHVFVEDVTVKSIAAAREAYRATDLKERLGRYHADPDGAFRGWNDIWLDPDFRAWNIEEYLPRIACPILAIQGRDDEYGTLGQLDAIASRAGEPVERVVLDACRHSPHRDQPEKTLETIVEFVQAIEKRS